MSSEAVKRVAFLRGMAPEEVGLEEPALVQRDGEHVDALLRIVGKFQ